MQGLDESNLREELAEIAAAQRRLVQLLAKAVAERLANDRDGGKPISSDHRETT